jgi:hypothetical protein
MCKLIKLKTGLNLKVKKSSISRWLDDKSMWWLWAKKLSSLSIELALDDGWITMNDMKTIAKSDKGGWHNHCIKQSNKNASWTLVESWWGISYKTSLKALMEWVLLGIYYDTARTLVPADTKTEKIQAKCVAIAKKKWRYVTYEELKKMLK